MNMTKGIDFLKAHESADASQFENRAKWRQENKTWLKWSRSMSLLLIQYMEANGLNRNGLAERLQVSPQYVSKLLSGKVNFSFKSVAELEEKLGMKCIDILEPA
jgi:ribosome-binding protein aMBF1 (putative translation factor)